MRHLKAVHKSESAHELTKGNASYCPQQEALVWLLSVDWLPCVCQHAKICAVACSFAYPSEKAPLIMSRLQVCETNLPSTFADWAEISCMIS